MKITVKIKTLSGRKLEYELEDTDTIDQLKELLQVKEGIPKGQIRIVLKGQNLKESLTLKEAKIQPEDQLMMMMHLKGGF